MSRRDLDLAAALLGMLLDHHDNPGDARFRGRPGREDLLREVLAVRLGDPEAHLALAEGASGPVGLVVVRVLERLPLFRETRRGEIEHLVVRPEARTSGAGRALANHAMAWLRERGVAHVDVQVARSNPSGRAFWDALGFSPSMDVLERPL